LLLHLVDATAEDPIADYHTITQELHAYGRGLPDRPQIIALNKTDAVDVDRDLGAIVAQLQTLTSSPVFIISAVTRAGLEPLLNQIWQQLDAMKAAEEVEQAILV